MSHVVRSLLEDDASNPVAAEMDKHGFLLQDTGGGMTAFTKDLGMSDSELSLIITEEGEAPQTMDATVTLGVEYNGTILLTFSGLNLPHALDIADRANRLG